MLLSFQLQFSSCKSAILQWFHGKKEESMSELTDFIQTPWKQTLEKQVCKSVLFIKYINQDTTLQDQQVMSRKCIYGFQVSSNLLLLLLGDLLDPEKEQQKILSLTSIHWTL